jgi:hypothetical protein
MTKAFLEPMVLKQKNEKLVVEAFSKKSMKKLKTFNDKRRTTLKKTTATRKLAVAELF